MTPNKKNKWDATRYKGIKISDLGQLTEEEQAEHLQQQTEKIKRANKPPIKETGKRNI